RHTRSKRDWSSDVCSSDLDLWRTVETAPSPHTVDIADFHAGESGENQQPYRALLIVTDGTAPGAETISITWPVDDENEWVPLAYAGGAAVGVVGLVLLVVSLSTGRRRVESESAGAQDAEQIEPSETGHDEPSEPGHDQPRSGRTDDTEKLDAVDEAGPSTEEPR